MFEDIVAEILLAQKTRFNSFVVFKELNFYLKAKAEKKAKQKLPLFGLHIPFPKFRKRGKHHA